MQRLWHWVLGGFVLAALVVGLGAGLGATKEQKAPSPPSSYSPVVIKEDFTFTLKKKKKDKPQVMKRQLDLLAARYDLANKPAKGVTMSRGKPIQEGVRVKLPAGLTWDKLAAMTPEEIKEKGLWPAGFLPLPHPNHAEGGISRRSKNRKAGT